MAFYELFLPKGLTRGWNTELPASRGETGHKVGERFPDDNRKMRGGLAVTAEGCRLACEDFLTGGLWDVASSEISRGSEELSFWAREVDGMAMGAGL